MNELISLEEIERISRCWGDEIELSDWAKLVETARAAHEWKAEAAWYASSSKLMAEISLRLSEKNENLREQIANLNQSK